MEYNKQRLVNALRRDGIELTKAELEIMDRTWVWMADQVVTCLVAPNQVCAQGARGGAAQPPQTGRAAAPVDLTGYWVSVVTEDWRFRMVSPQKGDYNSVPLSAEGRRVADMWDPAKDEAAGEQCKSYGAAGLMRVPGRLRITWENDNTLRVDTEAGSQTRLFHFDRIKPAGQPAWQGHSEAQWEFAGGRAGPGVRGGNLKVGTTAMRPGYLRKNGVPYSGNAALTEYYNRLDESNGDSWLIITTMVDDPQYLQQLFVTSTHFKKLAGTSVWKPEPCSAR